MGRTKRYERAIDSPSSDHPNFVITSIEGHCSKTAEGGPVPRLLLKGSNEWHVQGTTSSFKPPVKGQKNLPPTNGKTNKGRRKSDQNWPSCLRFWVPFTPFEGSRGDTPYPPRYVLCLKMKAASGTDQFLGQTKRWRMT